MSREETITEVRTAEAQVTGITKPATAEIGLETPECSTIEDSKGVPETIMEATKEDQVETRTKNTLETENPRVTTTEQTHGQVKIAGTAKEASVITTAT